MTNEELKRAVIDARKNKRYSEVIELASRTNYKKEPFDSEIAYSICHALYFMSGKDTEQKASKLATLFLEFYGECPNKVDFEYIKGIYIEYLGDNKKALTWIDKDSYPTTYERIKEKIDKEEAERKAKEEARAAREARELEERKKHERFLRKDLSDFDELSSVLKILNDNGISTVNDLSETPNAKIDAYQNMGPAKMEKIKEFKNKHGL
jgi:hypothetical protein